MSRKEAFADAKARDIIMGMFANCRRVVIKVGSSTLTHETGNLNLRRIEELVKILSDLKNGGKEVIQFCKRKLFHQC